MNPFRWLYLRFWKKVCPKCLHYLSYYAYADSGGAWTGYECEYCAITEGHSWSKTPRIPFRKYA